MMSSSKGKGKGHNSASKMIERKQHLRTPTPVVQQLLSLMRIRDFLSLVLSYPMRTGNEKFMKEWINEVSRFIDNYSAVFDKLNTADNDERLSTVDMPFFDSLEVEILLSPNPLRYVGGLIPKDIIRDIRNGGSFILNASKSEKSVELTTATSSASKEKQLKQAPQPILHLATHLAAKQLSRTLERRSELRIQNVKFSTRNDAEKRTAVKEIKAAYAIGGPFWGVQVFDVSKNQREEEFDVLGLEVRRWLKQSMSTKLEKKDDNVYLPIFLAREREEYGRPWENLVLVVDGDGDMKLDPCMVRFPKRRGSADIVVFITTESSTQQTDELTMGVDLVIRTEDHLLPWEVFCKSVGSELVHSSSEIQSIAVQIVLKCGGHLLATLLVAKSLQNVEDVQLWKLSLEKLHYPNLSYKFKRSNNVNVLTNAFINIIWVDVTFEREKPRLMHYLKVFKSGYLMMGDGELFENWFSEHLLKSQEEAEHSLRELVERSLLLEFEDNQRRYILLPEEINVILEALQKEDVYEDLKKSGLGLTEPPKVWDWHGAAKIELMHNNISELPQSPNCPRLQELYLHGNSDLMEIPPSFFNHMPLLSILHLSCTSIHDLPSSFFKLEELREFYLKDCELFMELPPEIGRLKNLKKLDLDGTQITHLPQEIRQLTNLESLSLSFYGYHHDSGRGKKCMEYSSSVMIPLGLISKLTHLESLRIDVNPDNEWWHKNLEHILAEIFGLKRLRSLDLYVPEFKLLKLPSCLSHFRFIVGHHMQRIISRAPPAVEVKFKQSNRSLRFINGVNFPNEVKNILGFAQEFFLDRHMTINHLFQFGLENLQQLRLCILGECNEMLSIVNGEDPFYNGLANLEFLTIYYMKNLRSIVQRPTPPRHLFCELRFLALHTCPELTTIFTVQLLDNFCNLEELIIEDCPKVSSLISFESLKPKSHLLLPRLRRLSLLYLPNLVSICYGLHIGRFLEQIQFYYCPKLESFSSAELSSANLKVVRGEIKWWEALKWSEAEWGRKGRPDKFNHIFCPIDEEFDVLTQLTTGYSEYSNSNEERDSGGSQLAKGKGH